MDSSHFSELHASEVATASVGSRDLLNSDSSDERPDRLSELPDFLINAILSLLPMTDVVATMLLSKRWVHLWTTAPCLDLGNRHPMFRNNLQKYPEFVSGAIAHWKGSKIQKFSLAFNMELGGAIARWKGSKFQKFSTAFNLEDVFLDATDIDLWLLFAIKKQVEELQVHNGTSQIEYCAPQHLYSCSSITKMSLGSCKLRIDESVQWNRLKILEMRGVECLSEDAMNRILAGAPLLEEMTLEYVRIRENLNIRSTSLKKLDFGFGTSFEAVLRIWAPNLLDLEISGYFCGGTFFLDVPSLTNVILCLILDGDLPPVEMFNQVFQSIRHVEKLTLSSLSIQFIVDMKKKDMVLPFTNAKFLKLCACNAHEMVDVLDMFPQMIILVVEFEQEYGREVDLVKMSNLPSPSLLQLKTVDVTWPIKYKELIIPAIEVMLQNAHLLDKLVFRPQCYKNDADLLTVEKMVLSMPRSSPTAEVIIVEEFFHTRSAKYVEILSNYRRDYCQR